MNINQDIKIIHIIDMDAKTIIEDIIDISEKDLRENIIWKKRS